MKKRYRRRPGVVLLIVLSLLVLFTLMAVTFVVISAQFRNAAVSASRYRKTGDDPRKYFEIAISQLLRDTDGRSSLNSQSLLRDLYGTDFAKGTVSGVTSEMGGEFLSITVTPTAGFSVLDDSFVGCVITMLDGNARGLSSRIVDYDANPGADGQWGVAGTDDNKTGGTDEMEEFMWPQTPPCDDYLQIRCEAFLSDTHNVTTPNSGDTLLINGRPFNGTGFGYDTGTDNLDGDIFLPGPDRKWGVANKDDDSDGFIDEIDEGGWSGSDDIEIPDAAALLCHAVAARYENGLNLGGADESWDAVDFQNMYLAMVPPDLATVGEIIPSFHRPALLRYVFEQLRAGWTTPPLPVNFGATDALGAWTIFNNPSTATSTLTKPQKDFIVDVKRACTFRPLPEDHPNFNGTNAAFNYMGNSAPTGYGPLPAAWDVDNDGDGTPDSIWIDIGLPVQTSPSGKLYKPLVAILCQDLDGRLNVNAHGNLEHDSILTYDSTAKKYTLNAVTETDAAVTNPTPSVAKPTLPRGGGVGPAEVVLAPLFNASSSDHTSVLENRYAAVTDSSDDRPGVKSTDDVTVGSLRTRDVPATYATTARASYSSQPDLRGMGAIYLDHTGHPKVAGNWTGNERMDDPYEILLSMNGYGDTGSSDRPFTLAEFERLLRFDDYDSWKLPTRLIRSAPTSFTDAEVRRLLTVHSSYLPAPKHGVPREAWSRTGATTPTTDRQRLSILDLIVGKLRDNSVAEVDIPGHVATLLPFELQHGELLDINRLLGNGVDDDSDGIVDERGEQVPPPPLPVGGSPTPEQTWPGGPAGFAVDFDHQNDDPKTSDARQNLARHLFCLLMTVIDEPRVDPGDLNTLPSVKGFARAMPMTPMSEFDAFKLDTTLPQTAVTLAANRQKVRALVSLMIRRYAQWSVNAVDFRDSDSIMTGFEYDPNPFDGWHVDGNLATDEGTDGVDNDGDGATDELDELRGVVWGVEYPDLLLTEATAFHDRRVKDTDVDTTGAKRLNSTNTAEADDDMDQYRIPQGSLFLEFYCPRPRHSNNPVVPGELYYVNNNALSLDLARFAPATTDGHSYPVWRVAISASHWGDPEDGDANESSAVSPLNRKDIMPHTTSFDPGYLSTLHPVNDPYQTSNPQTLAIERQIWFTTLDPTTKGFTPQEAEQIFYNRSGKTAVNVRPGGYLVVGPRPETRLGSALSTIDMPVVAPQRIVINDWSKGTDGEWGIKMVDDDGNGTTDDASEAGWPGSDDVKGLTYYNAAGTASTPANIRTALSAVIAANPPPFWTNAGTTAPTGIGINVSEPLPINVVRDAAGNPVIDSGTSSPIRVYYQEPTDTFAPGLPLDSYHVYDGTTPGTLPDAPFDSDVIRDSAGAAVPEAAASTRPLFTDGILDTDTNENYRTAFVQRLADPTRAFDLATNPYITIDWSPIDLTVFNGEEQNPPPASWNPNMLPGIQRDPDDPVPLLGSVCFNARDRNGTDFNLWAQTTRSPTDQGVTASAGSAAYFDKNLTHSLGYLNPSDGFKPQAPLPTSPIRRGGIDQYRGDPIKPFPWLTIHNRPYASPMELLLVPSCSPSRLGQEFGFLSETAGTLDNPYTDLTGEAPYPHLLNFFQETTTTATGADLYRLLDFVETPSQYAGTEKWYRPATFEGSTAAGNTFRPPYNRLSRFRDPGRVNINTIFDSRVWEGITKTFPSMDPRESTTLRNNMVLSRQGFGDDPSADVLAFAGSGPVYYPSRFANPFRSAFSADLMPNIADMRKQGVAATLMRSNPFDDSTTTPPTLASQPLFAYTQTDYHHINTDRNPFFRYQAYQHLGNTLSTTSNVFAIWMTVGFFEVEENLVSGVRVTDAAHPDGYRLGIELGLDTGEIKRHRAFYIVDRSVPVAFEPDKNHNIDRAILLERFIE